MTTEQNNFDQSIRNNFDTAVNVVMDNLDLFNEAFAKAIISDKEVSRKFKSLSKEQKQNYFQYMVNAVIGDIAFKVLD